MKNQDRYSNSNGANRSLALMLVVLLMLLAPCKIRHAIQTQLQAPVTKSLNLTKAALSTSTPCQISPELAVKKKAGSKTNPDCCFPALLPEALHPVLLSAGSGSQKLVVADRYWSGAIPLYILYRKMRVLS